MKNLTKEFQYEGNNYYFETTRFRNVINKKLEELRNSGEKKSKQAFLEDIADAVGCSSSSLNHWYMGHNAPNEFEKIQDMATYLQVDLTNILKKNEEMGDIKMMNTENRTEVNTTTQDYVNYADEKSIIRDIYHDMVTYIEEFRDTTAFHYVGDVWIDSVNLGNGEIVDSLFEARQMYTKILKKIKMAMLDIPYSVFNNLKLFASGYLEDFLGLEVADIWEIGSFSDEELVAQGIDLETYNQYARRFIGYMTYCRDNELEDVFDTRMQYVNLLADRAYEILEEILAEYIRK